MGSRQKTLITEAFLCIFKFEKFRFVPIEKEAKQDIHENVK